MSNFVELKETFVERKAESIWKILILKNSLIVGKLIRFYHITQDNQTSPRIKIESVDGV